MKIWKYKKVGPNNAFYTAKIGLYYIEIQKFLDKDGQTKYLAEVKMQFGPRPAEVKLIRIHVGSHDYRAMFAADLKSAKTACLNAVIEDWEKLRSETDNALSLAKAELAKSR